MRSQDLRKQESQRGEPTISSLFPNVICKVSKQRTTVEGRDSKKAFENLAELGR